MDTPTDPVEETATPLGEIIGEPPAEPMEELPPEPGDEPTPEPAPAAAAPEPKAPTEPFWYRKTLREKEAELRTLRQQMEQFQTQQPAPQAAPDPYEDPQGYQASVQQTVQQALFSQRLEFSEMRARDKFGDDAWEETNDWLRTRPDVAQWAASQRDPCGAAVQIYQREKLAAEIGDNPDQWREKERERLRQEVLAEMQQQPAQQAANPITRPIIPGPGSQARSAAPKGNWTGPTPVSAALKNSF